MTRLPTPGGDNNNWGTVLNDFLSQAHNPDGTIKDIGVVGAKADDNTVIHNTGDETVGGIKSFSSSPIVPTPTTGNQSANKTYVDSTVTGGAPVTSVATKTGAVTLVPADVPGVETTAHKDQPNGYAGLDGSALLKLAELPSSVLTNNYGSPVTFNVTGVPLTLIGGGSGNPVQTWVDKPTGKTLMTVTNISAAGYAASQNFYGTNCIGGADATGANLGWQQTMDQAAPIPDRDFVPVVKVRRSTLAGVVTTAGGTAITAPAGTFDLLNDAGLIIQSANIPSQILASVTDSSHATLTTGTGVTAGTANATLNGARDLEYWFHNGIAAAQLGLFPRSYVSGAPPTLASVHIGGPYGNANDPQQLDLIPGVSQVAPVLGMRRLNEAQPVMTWALSGGVAAALVAPAMSLGNGGGVWGTGGGTAPDLVVGRTSPGPAWTVQRAAAGVTQLLTLQNPQAADGAGIRLGFSMDTFIAGAIDLTNTTYADGRGAMSFKVGSSGGKGTMVERMIIDKNNVAFNGKTPFFPNATPANATAVASTASTSTAPFGYTTQAQADAIVTTINALVTAVNFWNVNLKAYGLST